MVSTLTSSLSHRMPAEWESQEAVLFSWPNNHDHWNEYSLSELHHTFAQIVATLSRTQNVQINIAAPLCEAAAELIKDSDGNLNHVQFLHLGNDDVWCRDHGPILTKACGGELQVTDWQFNGWGDKFHPYDTDNQVASKYAEHFQLPVFSSNHVLEGGAIEVNGRGLLLTTEAVLKNPNRYTAKQSEALQQEIADQLGIHTILWLNEGLEGDDTDGHIDDLARFTPENNILTVTTENTNLANYKTCQENWQRLQQFTKEVPDLANREIIPLPLPEVRAPRGWRLPILPASYANYLVTNETVLVPTFEQTTLDKNALSILQEHYPTRDVIGINALPLVTEGGAIHCISQQIPKREG